MLLERARTQTGFPSRRTRERIRAGGEGENGFSYQPGLLDSVGRRQKEKVEAEDESDKK